MYIFEQRTVPGALAVFQGIEMFSFFFFFLFFQHESATGLQSQNNCKFKSTMSDE